MKGGKHGGRVGTGAIDSPVRLPRQAQRGRLIRETRDGDYSLSDRCFGPFDHFFSLRSMPLTKAAKKQALTNRSIFSSLQPPRPNHSKGLRGNFT